MQRLERIGGARIDVPEASDLAWDPMRGVLVTVGDDSGCAFEVSLSSFPAVTRTIRLERGDEHDLEGIAITADGRHMLVASEKRRRILVYDREGALLDHVKLHVGHEKNEGLEGLAVDAATGRIFAVNERKPRRLIELDAKLAIVDETDIEHVDDLSAVCARDGALWLLSDRSRVVLCMVERDGAWTRAGAWRIDASDAEGMAIVGDRIYVVRDHEGGDNLAWYRLPDHARSR